MGIQATKIDMGTLPAKIDEFVKIKHPVGLHLTHEIGDSMAGALMGTFHSLTEKCRRVNPDSWHQHQKWLQYFSIWHWHLPIVGIKLSWNSIYSKQPVMIPATGCDCSSRFMFAPQCGFLGWSDEWVIWADALDLSAQSGLTCLEFWICPSSSWFYRYLAAFSLQGLLSPLTDRRFSSVSLCKRDTTSTGNHLRMNSGV